MAARDNLLPAIRELFAPMTLPTLSERLDRAGLPFSPINTPGDLFDDPHLTANGGLLPIHLTEGEHAGTEAALPRLPVEFGEHKPALHKDLPAVGAHSLEVLRELGLEDNELESLAAAGVIGS